MEQQGKAYEVRYLKALELVESGAVRRNGSDGTYDVQSQSGPWTFRSKTRRVTRGFPTCSCLAEDGKRDADVCEHVLACEILESAEHYTLKLKETHGLSWSELESRLIADCCHPHPKPTAMRLLVLLQTVRRLNGREDEPDPVPDEIALTVRHVTSGEATLPIVDEGELLQMEWNGGTIQPISHDLNTLYRWLASKGFEPTSFRWIDQPGYIRRRLQVYRRSA